MRTRTKIAALAGIAVLVVIGVAAAISLGRPGDGAPGVALGAPHYVDEAHAAGIEHAYDGEFEYFVGGGAAAFDCNGDRRPELFLAGGAEPAALFVNSSARGGALRFSRLAADETDLTAVTGAYPLDVDADGSVDLALLRRGENVLLRGLGECRFERANEQWGFNGGEDWSTAFSAKWDAVSEWPTVAVGNYLAPRATNEPFSCADNQLYRPSGSGSGFEEPTPLSPSWCTLSMLFTDWDRSGRRDLRVSNDRHYYSEKSDGAEQLWRVAPSEAPRQYTEADGWQRLRVWGMGIGDYDLTGDGYPDYYLTSQADNKLQVLADGPSAPRYEDVALRRGVTAHRPYAGDTDLPSTAWHAEFQDVNNDGYVDLFVAKGNVEAMPEYAARDPSNLFMGQADGSFVEGAGAAGIVDFARARGAVLADLNLDGLLDLVVVPRRENARVYRNFGSGTFDAPAQMGNWIALELSQAGGNAGAVGSWIEVRVGDHLMQRELTVGGGHVSGEHGPVHFGLGPATSAEVRITWPDGAVGEWRAVQADHVYAIDRESAEPEVIP